MQPVLPLANNQQAAQNTQDIYCRRYKTMLGHPFTPLHQLQLSTLLANTNVGPPPLPLCTEPHWLAIGLQTAAATEPDCGPLARTVGPLS